MKYRIGIDLGTNSLGWAAVQLSEDLKPRQLMDMGSRIFSDSRNPKDKSSNASKRREPRSIRRNRDRKLARGRAMMHVLIEAGLMPKKESDRKILEAHDPWILRARSLHEKLSLHELGRALFHLQQRRGFKSNRKTDGVGDGAMLDAIKKSSALMSQHGAKTLGELFGKPRLEQIKNNETSTYGKRKPLPQARVKAQMDGPKMAYDYYPSRSLILDEFEKIWDAQTIYHPNKLNNKFKKSIRKVIEYQRPLKPQKVGRCTFLEEEPRAPKALPTAQYARILQEVNALKVGATGEIPRPLNGNERTSLIKLLITPSYKTSKRTFKTIRKELNLPDSQKFSHESNKRDHLMGDTTAARLMQEDSWGKSWFSLTREEQDIITIQLLECEQSNNLINWLQKTHNIGHDHANNIEKTILVDSHGKLSKAALEKILPYLENGLRYDEAVQHAFGDNAGKGDGVIYDEALPYYGEVLSRHTAFAKDNPKNDEERFGRVANPTVHVAMNELRKVVNDLIKRWGAPEQVVLELARDLPLSDRGLKELERQQTKNQKSNEERNEWLEANNLKPNYDNRFKLRLFEENLESNGGIAKCVFSGKTISKTDCFSSEIEIEHLLPLSKTLDDSLANKVLCYREANRLKGNKSPYEAFGNSPSGYDWESISQRASQLNSNKAWRFTPNAMEQWKERGGGFLDRQLNDTRYISRLGKTFIESLFGGQGSKGQSQQVWVVPGRLTSNLRQYAGFNSLVGLTGGNRKDRTDHRHHAVDALVIALTDQAMVHRAANLVKNEDRLKYSEIMKTMAEPLKRYRLSAEDRLSKLIVSHKPDHGIYGGIHEDTALGITSEINSNGMNLLVTRKSLSDLTDINKILDEKLRTKFESSIKSLPQKDIPQALVKAGMAMTPPVYKVRIMKYKNPSSFITIQHGKKNEFKKAYLGGSNYCYDIFVGKNGKWDGEVISTFQAYQYSQSRTKGNTKSEWWKVNKRPDGSPLIMRIRKGDMLEINSGDDMPRCVIVYKFTKGRIYMSDHFEANASARISKKDILELCKSPLGLQKCNAVKVTVSPSGKIKRFKY